MQDLRLIGVHEDGMHLVLGDEDGNRFRLPLDEALRSVARREHPRPGQLPLDLEATLRPKDVQAMIRAGLTAEEVAERAGWTVEKVHRYEGPILAEREHVSGLAREARLRGRGGTHGAAPTLDERVAERLRSREIDASTAAWDSRRADRGSWTVLLTFDAGGRRRQAAWDFDPLARTVVARDDEARWLSEDEAIDMPGPIPAPHLAGAQRPTRLYDVEAEGGLGPSTRVREDETVDLMAAMRERTAQRGRRRRAKVSDVPGLDRAPVEALPLTELAADLEEVGPPPAAHPHPGDDSGDDPRGRRGDSETQTTRREATGAHPEAEVAHGDPAQRAAASPGEPTAHADATPAGARDDEAAPAPESPAAAADLEALPERDASGDNADQTRTGTPRDRSATRAGRRETEPMPLAEEARRTGTDAGHPGGQDAPGHVRPAARTNAGAKPKPPPARKSGRPSVPSWDDIVFGRRPD